MLLSTASNAGAASAARSVQDADVLRMLSDIMALSPDGLWLQALVEQAVGSLGLAYAWAHLTLPQEGARLFHSATAGSEALQAASFTDLNLQDLTTPDRQVAWLPEERLAELPCFGQEQAQACLVGSLVSPDGQPCGEVVFVWDEAPVSALACQYALQALVSHARYAVLGNLDLKAQTQRLRDAVEQYESMLHFAPVLFNAFEPDGRCVMWNKECERRFGWSQQEVCDHPDPLALFYPEAKERERVFDTLSSSPSRVFREWSPHTRNGERLHVLWSNLRMPNGRILNIGLDITERKRVENDILRLSKIDGLTECWNRKEIVERLGRMLDIAREGGASVTALMLDLDFFKRINDRHGHLTGDHALQHFCKQLRGCLRGKDQLGRLGGEEFLVLLHDVDIPTAQAVFERLRKQLQANPVQLGDELSVLTVSGGIASLLPDDLGTSTVLRRADLALYEAKRQGRDRVVVHADDSSVLS